MHNARENKSLSLDDSLSQALQTSRAEYHDVVSLAEVPIAGQGQDPDDDREIDNTLFQVFGSPHRVNTAGAMHDLALISNHEASQAEVIKIKAMNPPTGYLDDPYWDEMLEAAGIRSLRHVDIPADFKSNHYLQWSLGLCPRAICGEVCVSEEVFLGPSSMLASQIASRNKLILPRLSAWVINPSVSSSATFTESVVEEVPSSPYDMQAIYDQYAQSIDLLEKDIVYLQELESLVVDLISQLNEEGIIATSRDRDVSSFRYQQGQTLSQLVERYQVDIPIIYAETEGMIDLNSVYEYLLNLYESLQEDIGYDAATLRSLLFIKRLLQQMITETQSLLVTTKEYLAMSQTMTMDDPLATALGYDGDLYGDNEDEISDMLEYAQVNGVDQQLLNRLSKLGAQSQQKQNSSPTQASMLSVNRSVILRPARAFHLPQQLPFDQLLSKINLGLSSFMNNSQLGLGGGESADGGRVTIYSMLQSFFYQLFNMTAPSSSSSYQTISTSSSASERYLSTKMLNLNAKQLQLLKLLDSSSSSSMMMASSSLIYDPLQLYEAVIRWHHHRYLGSIYLYPSSSNSSSARTSAVSRKRGLVEAFNSSSRRRAQLRLVVPSSGGGKHQSWESLALMLWLAHDSYNMTIDHDIHWNYLYPQLATMRAFLILGHQARYGDDYQLSLAVPSILKIAASKRTLRLDELFPMDDDGAKSISSSLAQPMSLDASLRARLDGMNTQSTRLCQCQLATAYYYPLTQYIVSHQDELEQTITAYISTTRGGIGAGLGGGGPSGSRGAEGESEREVYEFQEFLAHHTNDVNAQHFLAQRFYWGGYYRDGIYHANPNYYEAIRYYLQAGLLGHHLPSLYSLGVMYLYGQPDAPRVPSIFANANQAQLQNNLLGGDGQARIAEAVDAGSLQMRPQQQAAAARHPRSFSLYERVFGAKKELVPEGINPTTGKIEKNYDLAFKYIHQAAYGYTKESPYPWNILPHQEIDVCTITKPMFRQLLAHGYPMAVHALGNIHNEPVS
jgi:hypothetical protein